MHEFFSLEANVAIAAPATRSIIAVADELALSLINISFRLVW
jgi:hypothetical protein